MNDVFAKKKVKILDRNFIFKLPKTIKLGEVLNNKLLTHFKKDYPSITGKVLIQGSNFGIYGTFFEKEYNKEVLIIEPNPSLLEISNKNTILNSCKKTSYKLEVLGTDQNKFDIYTNNENSLSYILLKSENGRVKTLNLEQIKGEFGCIFISICELNNADALLEYLDKSEDNKSQLIVIKKSCLTKKVNCRELKIIDECYGYYFLSKRSKEFYLEEKKAIAVKDSDTNNKLNYLVEGLNDLTKELSELKENNSISLNYFNVINNLRPSMEVNDWLNIERVIDDIIGIYEKEIYNLNKTLNKREAKIKALLNSNTWKYTQIARTKLGFDALTFDEYIRKNSHKQSFNQENIKKLKSDVLNIAYRQKKINNTIIEVIDEVPQLAINNNLIGRSILSNSNTTDIEAFSGSESIKLIELHKSKDFNRFNVISVENLNDEVFAGLAAIPSREAALKRVVHSLIHQVDQLGVYLNGWSHVPDFLVHPKIIVARSQDYGDLGDAGKFFWVNDFEGFYFSCDDDLVYPNDYIQRIIDKIKDYDYKAVVGWHGSVVSDSFKDYYDPKDRRVFSYSAGRPFDLDVHILGTGVLGFHSSTMKVKLADFERPNMADIFFARLGQQQNVRFVVMEHGSAEIETIEEFQEDSINKHGQKQVESAKNVRKYKNDISTSLDWRLNNSQSLNVLLIGRFDNFKKGGIHKSNLLIEKYLKKLGHKVYTIDSQSSSFDILDSKVDVAMVYSGDPNRPDYPDSIQKMDILRGMGVPILLNMSYNSNPVRSKFIAKTIKSYNQESNKSKVCLMAFSESIKFDNYLDSVKQYIVSFPKTIDVDNIDLELPSFNSREGIFFGDATKLNNPEITDGKVINWVSEARKRMPKTNFYVIKHYSGKFEIPNFEFAPFMESADLMRWISNRRLSICLNQFTTYEMVPVESQSVGTPVVYRSMLQSLNEAIGLTGVPVTEPNIFGEMCQWLYNDEAAWNEYSKLSLLNFKRNHIDFCQIGLETALRKVIAINGVN